MESIAQKTPFVKREFIGDYALNPAFTPTLEEYFRSSKALTKTE